MQQPTGGPILLFDTTPDEPKSLLELKAKKKTAPPAPTPGNTLGAPSNAPETPAQGGGARAAAGVLNAVDEDEEGGEEAPVPDAFDVEDDDEMKE